ncbi:MAG: hypothetical protein U9P72_08340 [Campylobacterota bacterium]|nr:hypothetical protein [Campylobacterota bacterium]
MDMIKCKSCEKIINKNSLFCPKCGEYTSKKTWFFLLVIITTIVILLDTPTLKEEIKESISITKKGWNKSGLGNYFNMSFIIKNESNYSIKNIKIKCDYYASDNVKIGTNYKRVDDTVKSNSSRLFNNLTMGYINAQAKTLRCEVIDFDI